MKSRFVFQNVENSVFFNIRSNEHFFRSDFLKNFFFSNYAKKKMKKRFFHFSHVITKFFIHNANELHKKKIIRKFFSFHYAQLRCLILLRHFFFDFWNARFFFFHRFLKSNWFFNTFSLFWNSSSRSIFIITLSCNEIFKHFIKKNRIASWSSFMKEFIEDLCLYVKNSI